MMIPSSTSLLAALSAVLAAAVAFFAYRQAKQHRPSPDAPPPAGAVSRTRTPYDDAGWDAYARPPHGLHAGNDTPDGTRSTHDAHHSPQAQEPSPTFAGAQDRGTSTIAGQPVRCPHCHSSHVDTRNRARKAGRTIGSILGATGGIALALAGAEAGAAAGIIAGPAGPVFGGLAGALIVMLAGSAAGSTIGSAAGIAIDRHGQRGCQCRSCGHAFSATLRYPPVPTPFQ
ncbi:hypothetical protein [Burkholderia pyrrocinia]|uniref:hypothetical protein n=1 Tax=Burkholderia pyrrocinia TaxID=60550 RepID=UPI001FC8A487|nr:hypothetical protein [Burkholderia pyrrocinia]